MQIGRHAVECSDAAVGVRTLEPYLPALMNLGEESESSIFIARAADRDFRVQVILQLDARILRLGNVSSERHEQITGHPLLNGNTSARVLLIASQLGVDGKLRDPRYLLQPVGYLARYLGGDQRFSAQASLGGVGICGLLRFAKSNQANDVCGRQLRH